MKIAITINDKDQIASFYRAVKEIREFIVSERKFTSLSGHGSNSIDSNLNWITKEISSKSVEKEDSFSFLINMEL